MLGSLQLSLRSGHCPPYLGSLQPSLPALGSLQPSLQLSHYSPPWVTTALPALGSLQPSCAYRSLQPSGHYSPLGHYSPPCARVTTALPALGSLQLSLRSGHYSPPCTRVTTARLNTIYSSVSVSKLLFNPYQTNVKS